MQELFLSPVHEGSCPSCPRTCRAWGLWGGSPALSRKLLWLIQLLKQQKSIVAINQVCSIHTTWVMKPFIYFCLFHHLWFSTMPWLDIGFIFLQLRCNVLNIICPRSPSWSFMWLKWTVLFTFWVLAQPCSSGGRVVLLVPVTDEGPTVHGSLPPGFSPTSRWIWKRKEVDA